MESVAAILAAMGTGQTFLALVFVGCYAWSLSQFAGTRARLVMIVMASFAGAGFLILSDPWEAGVSLLALVPVGMGVFAAAVWILWKVLGGNPRQAVLDAPASLQPLPRPASSASLLERLRAKLHFT